MRSGSSRRMLKGRLCKAFQRRWRKLSKGMLAPTVNLGYGDWAPLDSSSEEEEECCCRGGGGGRGIPEDVPKGHTVVYVGQQSRRFVIHLALLQHPLFLALLDQAREEFGFRPAGGRLRLPCDESIFIGVLHTVRRSRRRRRATLSLCL